VRFSISPIRIISIVKYVRIKPPVTIAFYVWYNYDIITKKHITEEEAKLTGKRLSIKWDKFNVDQFRIGMEVELEHGTIKKLTNISSDHLLTTAKIALAHLNEIPDYYTRLLKMEKEAKKKNPK